MHQVDRQAPLLRLVRFGFDAERLYIRVDGTRPMRDLLEAGFEVRSSSSSRKGCGSRCAVIPVNRRRANSGTTAESCRAGRVGAPGRPR